MTALKKPVPMKNTVLLHGGDYNPDQWLDHPEIFEADLQLMREAGCNAMSVGIFAWSRLEPAEGQYDFAWLDQVMDRLWENGIHTILATPSGARPAWMSQKYPEVLRVDSDRVRILHGSRHNHCFTSPVYREKTRAINRALALHYAGHPGLLLWHISNEFGTECHCDLCQEAFRDFLKVRYKHSLEALNQAWWTDFWSHRYTDWSQVESPSPHGEIGVHGLNLDWHRFVTAQTMTFIENETAPLRELTPSVPITTNLMENFYGLDYFKLAGILDIVSWDNYPDWHSDRLTDIEIAADTAFVHDLMRSLRQGQPFLLMESTPSLTNWHPYNKLKRPGMHLLSSLQAVAHGADSVQYFQWRKSRGSSEKFHGAVVDHVGHGQTRVFREVSQVGEALAALQPVLGSRTPAEVALIFDWENRWAFDNLQGLTRDPEERGYLQTAQNHYRAFWQQGIPVDFIDEDAGLMDAAGRPCYKLVVAPILYMVRAGLAAQLDAFVHAGGTLVLTYLSGQVNASDLCFLGGFPGPLRKLAGIWAEETDTLFPTDRNRLTIDRQAVAACDPALQEMADSYEVHTFCDLIHAETADVLATYASDFYAGRPALTRNQAGQGIVYYLAARTEDLFLTDFYRLLADGLDLKRALPAGLPAGVSVGWRCRGNRHYRFIQNFTTEQVTVSLGTLTGLDLLTGQRHEREAVLAPYQTLVLSSENG